jgi:TPR repeat protein
MRTAPPTALDVERFRLTADEYFGRAREAGSPDARKKLEAIAREYVELADKAQRAVARIDEAAGAGRARRNSS